jgi:hypothetical protein
MKFCYDIPKNIKRTQWLKTFLIFKIQNIIDYSEVSKLIRLGQQCTKKSTKTFLECVFSYLKVWWV